MNNTTSLTRSPNNRRFLITLLLAPVLCGFRWEDVDPSKVVSGGGKVFKSVTGISEAEESKIGREVAANLAARYGLVQDRQKTDYLNLVGRAVARRSSRPKLAYFFGILKSNEVNALAAPGGYVFVTEGLLASVQDESELAGVLAHEISHITEKHIVKAIRQANLVEGSKDLAEASGHDMSAYDKLSALSIHLLDKGLSREDELEADRAGTVLAARVGYDATGLRRSVERLGQREKTDSKLARFTRTHPPAADRLKLIDQTLKKNRLNDQGKKLSERFRTSLGGKLTAPTPTDVSRAQPLPPVQ